MAASSPASPNFNIGFELELVVSPNERKIREELERNNLPLPKEGKKTWRANAEPLADVLSVGLLKLGLPIANVNWAADGDYSGLSLVEDISIKSQDPGFKKTSWPIEFVSPPFNTQDPRLHVFITAMFSGLKAFASIEDENSSCGLHVHISPNRGTAGWTFDELQAIACAIVAFDPTIDALVPPARRQNNLYIATNIHATQVKADLETPPAPHYGVAFDHIAALIDLDDLITYISTDVRRFAWDFGHLVPGNCGTIEFRRPPMVTDAEAVEAWIEFVALFAQAAVSEEGKRAVQQFRSLKRRASVEELYEFMFPSVSDAGTPSLLGNKAKSLFRDKDGTMKKYNEEMTMPLANIDVEAMNLQRIILAEKSKLKGGFSKFVAEFGRSNSASVTSTSDSE